jgi:TolB-like protein
MKTLLRHAPLVIAALALTAPSPVALVAQDAEPDARPGVAVMPFDNGGSHGDEAEEGDFEALEVGLQQMLLTELAQNTALRVVERGQLRQILAEQDLRSEGRVDPSTAAQLGRLVGARYMVMGSFTDLFGRLRMDARIVDVETGEILRSERVDDRREEIYELLVDLAAALTEGLDLPPLPAEQREARRAREIPAEAVTLYSRAQVYQDAGRTEQAITLYRRIADEFPDMVEAREALEQLTGA